MAAAISDITSWLRQRRVAVRIRLVAICEAMIHIAVTHGFRCLGIFLFALSAVLPVVTYRARCRYGLSNVLFMDALLSLLLRSGFSACLQISHDKAVQVLREFPPVFAIVLSVQAAGLIPILRSQPLPRGALFCAVASTAVFMIALSANLYWVIIASYGGANVDPWQLAALMGFLLFGTGFTFLGLDRISRIPAT